MHLQPFITFKFKKLIKVLKYLLLSFALSCYWDEFEIDSDFEEKIAEREKEVLREEYRKFRDCITKKQKELKDAAEKDTANINKLKEECREIDIILAKRNVVYTAHNHEAALDNMGLILGNNTKYTLKVEDLVDKNPPDLLMQLKVKIYQDDELLFYAFNNIFEMVYLVNDYEKMKFGNHLKFEKEMLDNRNIKFTYKKTMVSHFKFIENFVTRFPFINLNNVFKAYELI